MPLHGDHTPRASAAMSGDSSSSWTHSTSAASSDSSADTSELSTAHILTRTDEAHHASFSPGPRLRDELLERHENVSLSKLDEVLAASSSSSSINTYDSRFSQQSLRHDSLDDGAEDIVSSSNDHFAFVRENSPPANASPSRPSDPYTFGRLFPSMKRLSIRHDDHTSDAAMNLRVDTTLSANAPSSTTIQLFHLRMRRLSTRDFSLRRYARDSGREVCFSKRAFTLSPRHAFHHSVSSALRSVKAPFRHASSTPSLKFAATPSDPDALVPTDTIKLEFSNYARVNLTASKRHYDFEWWGHKYTWTKTVDKALDTFSFHLVRQNARAESIAHIAQEIQSPYKNGWIPPCYMWISDRSILEAMTDVADIIVATGLLALADDCIREYEHAHKEKKTGLFDLHDGGDPSARRGLFARQNSGKSFRLGKSVVVY